MITRQLQSREGLRPGMRLASPVLVFLVALNFGGTAAWAQAPFTEEAISRGLFAVTPFADGGPFGQGIAANDFDGDGDPDLLVTGSGLGVVSIWENTGGGQFVDRTPTSGLPATLAIQGLACADFDGDGDLDVYFTAYLAPNVLYRNDGGLVFTKVSNAGVDDPGQGAGACWGDYDGDGRPDLYAVNYAAASASGTPIATNRLYHNNGDGTFTDVAPSMGVDDSSAGFQAMWFDHDNDGDLDLYLANDFSTGNRLWRNDDGQLVDISAASGADLQISAMGIAIADLDQNGYLDIFCSDDPPLNEILLNNGDGTYDNVSAEAEAAGAGRGWGSTFLDFDNDGFLDLFVAQTFAPNVFFTYEGALPFVEKAVLLQIDDAYYNYPAQSYCSAKADVDGDGDQDLFVQSFNEPIALYINNAGGSGHHLRIRLQGAGLDPFAIGAMVTTRVGTDMQLQQLYSGTSLKSSDEFTLHFGVGEALTVDEVLVRWPDGNLSLLSDVAVDQTLIIDQASAPAATDCDGNLVPDLWQIAADPTLDSDGDGALDSCIVSFLRGDSNLDENVDLADAIAMLSHLFVSSSLACRDAGDANDDGSVDVADPIYLLSFLFVSGPALPLPQSCDQDPTADSLGCVTGCSP